MSKQLSLKPVIFENNYYSKITGVFLDRIIYDKEFQIYLSNETKEITLIWDARDIIEWRVIGDEAYSIYSYPSDSLNCLKSSFFCEVENSNLKEELLISIPKGDSIVNNIKLAKHYGIFTQEECIDIVAMEEPQVKVRKVNLWKKLKWKFMAFKEKKILNL